MRREDFFDLSPAQLYENFNQVRHHLSKQTEEKHAHEHDAKKRTEWLEKRPKKIEQRFLEKAGITHEDIEKHLAEEAVLYKRHYESTGIHDSEKSADPDFGLGTVPESNASAAFPYAVVLIGSTGDAFENFKGEASGNPDAWKLAGFSARQEFFLDLWGSGTGFYDFSLIPEYNTHRFLEVQWYFIHVPFGDGEWSCSASPWFHGAYHVWSDDYLLTSRFAQIVMGARIRMFPFGYPSPKYQAMQYSSDCVIYEGGQNIDKARWGGWLPSLSKLYPEAAHRQKPHWIIVSAEGEAVVRGYAHARLNFADGFTTSGSIEGGSYRETKYGVYCHTAKIHW